MSLSSFKQGYAFSCALLQAWCSARQLQNGCTECWIFPVQQANGSSEGGRHIQAPTAKVLQKEWAFQLPWKRCMHTEALHNLQPRDPPHCHLKPCTRCELPRKETCSTALTWTLPRSSSNEKGKVTPLPRVTLCLQGLFLCRYSYISLVAGTFKGIAGDNPCCSFWIGLKAFTLVQCFLRKIIVSPTNLKRQEVAV